MTLHLKISLLDPGPQSKNELTGTLVPKEANFINSSHSKASSEEPHSSRWTSTFFSFCSANMMQVELCGSTVATEFFNKMFPFGRIVWNFYSTCVLAPSSLKQRRVPETIFTCLFFSSMVKTPAFCTYWLWSNKINLYFVFFKIIQKNKNWFNC